MLEVTCEKEVVVGSKEDGKRYHFNEERRQGEEGDDYDDDDEFNDLKSMAIIWGWG